MKQFRKYLVEFFGFSHGESKGFIVFLGIVLIFSTLSSIIPSALFSNDFDAKTSSAKIDGFLHATKLKSSKTSSIAKEDIKISDPNTMSFFDWTNIGLDQNLANRIVSYRLKGGQFRNKNDLKKIYGLNDSIYSEIDQFLHIEEPEQFWVKYTPSKSEERKPKVSKYYEPKLPVKKPNLNSCDSTDLLFIKGIGPTRAARIIKYRTNLGGFNNKSQLSEIYGLDSLVIENLIINTVIEKDSALKKMDINAISFKDLIKHPYVDYNTCKVILNFRNQHGDFKSMDDLKKIKIIKAEFISKIEPYIQFQ